MVVLFRKQLSPKGVCPNIPGLEKYGKTIHALYIALSHTYGKT